MDGEINIPDGLLHFRIGETLVPLDPIEAVMACDAIAVKTKGTTNFEYLDEFIVWVKTQAEVELSRGQAYAVWNALYLHHAQSQKSFTDALKSLTSMDSTPAA